MIIHVVEPGETIYSIAEDYNVDPARLILENDLIDPEFLAVGQTIIIVYPEQIHIVAEGDTLAGIADNYNMTVLDLLRNNPFLLDRDYLYEGEMLVIRYAEERKGNIKTNGYAYPFIDRNILEKNLLYLTYLSIFSYSISPDGSLDNIDDIELVNLARQYNVAPIMVISDVTEEGGYNRDIIHNLLTDTALQNNMYDSIVEISKEKGYYGVNIDTPYIYAEDRERYIEVITNLTNRLKSEGIYVFITVSPNAFGGSELLEYDIINYTAVADIIDGVVLLTYSRGYLSEIPISAIPFNYSQVLLRYLTTLVPPEKINIGVTTIGDIFPLPFIEGVSRAVVISNANAIELAVDAGTEIYFNQNNLSSYFYIMNDNLSLVYFHNGRSLNAYLSLAAQQNLQGIAIWNVMYFLAQEFLIIHTQYYIDKVI